MPRGKIQMTYYFQYGTPMLDRTLDRRIDTLRLEGQGRLDGWRMDFSRPGGQPNLVADPQGKVWGLLYLIELSHLPELDQAEPGKRHEGKCSFEGEPEACVFYTYPSQPSQPGADYLTQLRSVYVQASLPQAQIDQALGVAGKV